MRDLRGPQRVAASQNVLPRLQRRVAQPAQHGRGKAVAVAQLINTRAESVHAVEAAHLALAGQSAEKDVRRASTRLSPALELARGDPRRAAQQLFLVEVRAHQSAALRVHAAERPQNMVRLAVGRAIGVGQRRQTICDLLRRRAVTALRQVHIALMRQRVPRLEDMGRGAVHNSGADGGKNYPVE